MDCQAGSIGWRERNAERRNLGKAGGWNGAGQWLANAPLMGGKGGNRGWRIREVAKRWGDY